MADRESTVRAEVIFAGVDRRAPRTSCDAGLPQDGHRPTLPQHAFQRAQLGVDVPERRQLGENQRVVALPEAVQVEHQPAKVAIAELARPAQEARTAPGAAARAEAARLVYRCSSRGRLLCRLCLLRRLCWSIGGSGARYLIHGRFMLPRPSVREPRSVIAGPSVGELRSANPGSVSQPRRCARRPLATRPPRARPSPGPRKAGHAHDHRCAGRGYVGMAEGQPAR